MPQNYGVTTISMAYKKHPLNVATKAVHQTLPIQL
jgi:hypothetical protein